MSSEPAEKKTKMPLTLAYWKIRGLAQPIRLLLKYNELEFDNVMYQQGDAPDYSREGWLSVKFTLGLDFPNLPYMIDGDTKITQSNAILRHVARKFDLCGNTETEMAMVDMLENQAMDFRNGFTRVCYNSNYESLKEDYIKAAKDKIKAFSTFLGGKKWFIGDKLTFVDFVLYELLDQHRMFEPSLFAELPNLKEFLDKFEALPPIKAYMESAEFIRYPVNNNTASWGGK
ncbi:glutathione S-transferase Mu 4-like [Halichondria panicea]|uniref:glutathione S-transferase Mu 4-like n=1 Tax=Halichondria panicea TaxID=6063 RepID=UPI00312B6CDD